MYKYIYELRDRILRCLFVLGLLFFSCFYFSNDLYSLLARPMLSQLPDAQLITTQVTAPFMVPMQLSFIVAVLICAPYILYNVWMFVRPGLYPHERKNIAPLLILSSILFYCGIAFAFFIVCPVALKFFVSSAPAEVKVLLDIGNFMDFIVTVALACGVAFQIPILTNLIIRSGIVTKQQLAAKRKHVIVLALVLGMLLAPPDVFSQILLAIPMWGLFELGLLFSSSKTNQILSSN